MKTTRESGRSAASRSEPASPSSDSVTHAATRWLAAMNDSDASDGGVHAAVVTPRVKKEQHLVSSDEAASDVGLPDRSGLWQTRRKREFQENGTAHAALQTPKKHKYRKSTINIRKGEIAKLLKELEGLHSRMEQLNARAMKPCPGDETPSEAAVANRVLRRAIKKQQRQVTQFHALMSEYSLFSIRVGSPIHQEIHLLRDSTSRFTTLTTMKTRVLEMGAHFLKDRCPRINPSKPMREDHGCEAPNGDFYATHFSTSQFDNSVKKVFDILLGYFSSIEICVSEKLGNVTIREDDDNLAPGVTLNRLVSTTLGGLRMESNTVYFSHYEEGGNEPGQEHGYGLFVADFVDEDERSPYHPHERIRRDFSAVLELTSYPIQRRTSGTKTVSSSSSRGEEGRVVVVTRWVHSRVHHPQYAIPLSGWHEMRENTESWIQTLHHAMLERYSASIEGADNVRC
ncbi:formate dehydrogenase (NAD+) [Phytophthora pseudosyringae]|uniref:Formate dehydrogenase (NAD+) n=1 Tax=Phytophthora pseudosyringae TaxID=221518 RepID=A0A8T1VHN7_9STRA|nr:formate dehydrogenase (NAD+) [Phytophthora pseudosyringae]